MARVLGALFRAVAYPFRVARRRPKQTLVVLGLLVLATGAGLYGRALRQWDAAREALQADRPEEARARLAFCLSVWPRSAEVHHLAARAARMTSDFEAAEAHLNRCLELEGGATAPVQLEFLLLRVQTGEVDEVAPALIQTADEGHPEAPLIFETVARSYMHHLRYQPAFACLSRWIELEPGAAKAHHWRGWVHERLDLPAKAMDDYKKALELDPDRSLVRLRVAEMLLEDKQPQEALPHLERLAKQTPDRPEVTARLGQCYFLLGRPAEARRMMEAAVAKLPNDVPLLLHLGRLELQENHPEEAERWLRQALRTEATDTEVLYTLFSALQVQNRPEEAAAVLREHEKAKALLERANHLLQQEAKRRSGGPDVPSEIGSLFLAIGRDRLGLYWFDQALARNPDHQPTHKALADYYDRKGDPQKAETHRRRLRDPDRAANR